MSVERLLLYNAMVSSPSLSGICAANDIQILITRQASSLCKADLPARINFLFIEDTGGEKYLRLIGGRLVIAPPFGFTQGYPRHKFIDTPLFPLTLNHTIPLTL